jgi:hypothetical protein
VTIAEPPAPYSVDYDAGAVSVAYETAPNAGTEIVANYQANESSIIGALSAANAHWFELSIEGTAQSPRERVLSVPFAQVAGSAEKLISNTDEISYYGPFQNVHVDGDSRYLDWFLPADPPKAVSNSQDSGFPYPHNRFHTTVYRAQINEVPFAELKGVSVVCRETSDSQQYYAKLRVTIDQFSLIGQPNVSEMTQITVDTSEPTAYSIEFPHPFNFDDNHYRLSIKWYNVHNSGIPYEDADKIIVQKIKFKYEQP